MPEGKERVGVRLNDKPELVEQEVRNPTIYGIFCIFLRESYRV